NSRGQAIVDRYVRGEDVPRDELRQVWHDTTQPHAAWLDPPAIVEAVRTINAKLPPDRRLRVLLGEPPIDWSRLQTPADLRAWEESPAGDRDAFGVDLIRREVLAKKRRALLLYGSGHFFRKPAHASIVTLLEAEKVQPFTVWTNAAAELSSMQANV